MPTMIRHFFLAARSFLSTSTTDKTLLETYAAIMATVITLLITVTLIPMQQCASQYSPSFLRYFQRDRQFSAYLFLMVATFIAILFFLMIPTYQWIDVAATVLVGISLLCVVPCVRHISVMLNPVKYLLPAYKQEVMFELKAAFRAADKVAEEDYEWKRGFELGEAVQDYPDIRERLTSIPADRLEKLRSGIMPLKTLALRLAGASDYEAFEQLIRDLGEISKQYIKERKSNRNYEDEFIWSLRSTFEDLTKTAESHPNASFSEVLYRTIADCAEATLEVDVLGRTKGYNHLQRPFTSLLIQSARRQLDRKETSSSLDAMIEFARVARDLARNKLGKSAQDASIQLYSFAIECLNRQDTYTCYPLFASMPRIVLLAAWNGSVYSTYDNPYDTMTAIIELMLEKSIEMKLEERLTDSAFGMSGDVKDSPNLSWICYAALFSPNNDKEVTSHVFRVVEGIWRAIQEHLVGARELEWQLIFHLYQIGLWILASLNREVFAGISYNDKTSIVFQTPSEPRYKLLTRILDYSWKAYGQAYQATRLEKLQSYVNNLRDSEKDKTKDPKGQPRYLNNQGVLLEKTLSLTYLALHFEKPDSQFVKDIKVNLSTLGKSLTSAKEPIEGAEAESLLLLVGHLRRTRDGALADELKSVIDTRRSKEAFKKEDVLTELVGPLFGFRKEVFSAWSNEIFDVGGNEARSRQLNEKTS